MLNRRTLRVKIMQSLFAFEQCKEANHELALDLIDERFAPDLNSMELQDKPLLKKRNKEARSLFQKTFKSEKEKESEDASVNDAVKEAVAFYQKQTKKDFSYFQKNLPIEVEKINHWYYTVLGLIIALAEAGKVDKKSNQTNFWENRFIKALQQDTAVSAMLLKLNAGWDNDKNTAQGWFRDVVKDDDTVASYAKVSSPTVEEDKSFVKHLLRKLIFGDTVINDFFVERNIRWTEDKDIVKSLVEKTIKSLDESGGIQLQKLSLDWEDDLTFMNILFEETTRIDKNDKDLIAKNTRNWEVDRLPLTDRIIIEMAITELIHFPSIPVKVSINEYIELTKHYSTPKSAKFINGILDVISKELVASGRVKKSGRGLIDNK
ncbi:MAG: transcription antitermination factor NusB [Cyclobacteriaceae bacterium]|nr:transcription antitermination factor NusB [Cyclobacteriaceae bacterium]